MKKTSLIKMAGIFVLLVMIIPAVFSDEKVSSIEKVIVEPFDSQGDMMHEDGQAVNWEVRGSKFSTEGYPKMVYVPNTWPMELFGLNPEEPDSLGVIGIQSKFDRMGYNHIELIPGKGEGDEWMEAPINLTGRVQSIDFWAWGSMFDYYIELHLMDYEGNPYVLIPKCTATHVNGSLKFTGWQNMQVKVPSYIKQDVVYQPRLATLRLTKIVISTGPEEVVNDFKIYLDHIKIITDTYESFFSGYDLANPEKIDEIWGTEE